MGPLAWLGMIRLGLALLCLALAAARERAAEAPPPVWKLAWSDEFDGAELDRGKWDFDLGNGFYPPGSKVWVGGWGNGELQYYTDRAENAAVRDGMLHIRALREAFEGCAYTSARLKTRKADGSALFATTYGRFEFRAKLPTGRGLWPAVWMLPRDETYGGWPASGEIDILEARGHQPDRVLGTLHFGGRPPRNAHAGREYVLPAGQTVADFHVYALEWEPGEIRWYVDDHLYATQNFWWSSGKRGRAPPIDESELNPWPAPFDRPFYLVMNLAVGGQLPGKPDEATPFPAEMVIDYVRVYEKVGGYGPPKPRGAGRLPFEKR